MPWVRMAFAEARKRAEETPVDRARIEALERGEFVRLHVVGVFGIRTAMGLSHEQFARRFGLDPDDVRDREATGGAPDETIRTYPRVIEREPEAIARAVAAVRSGLRDAAAAE